MPECQIAHTVVVLQRFCLIILYYYMTFMLLYFCHSSSQDPTTPDCAQDNRSCCWSRGVPHAPHVSRFGVTDLPWPVCRSSSHPDSSSTPQHATCWAPTARHGNACPPVDPCRRCLYKPNAPTAGAASGQLSYQQSARAVGRTPGLDWTRPAAGFPPFLPSFLGLV
jgi:hypothetical protein